jgi:pyrimidine operon attenuation protein/uracil phosphoribosyltransferase
MARHDQAEVGKMIVGLAAAIAAAFDPGKPINVVGIRTRGEVLAQRLVKLLGERGFAHIGRGVLDITLYRDDLSEVGPRPLVRPTRLDIAIDAVPLLLVDDVLFTGRSVRAALDALSDFGRPSVVRLVVLVDRGGRELPIQPDFAALKMADVPTGQRVKVRLSEVDGVDEIVVGPK